MGGLLLSLLAAFGLLAAPTSAQEGAPPAIGPEVQDILLAEKQCFACHQAPAGLAASLPSLPAPSLQDLGRRRSAGWLAAFLADPQAMRPGSRMPSLLHGLAPEERRQAAADLAAFLRAQGDHSGVEAVEVLPEMIATGAQAFDDLGCRSCHAAAFADRKLAAMTSIAALREELLAPLAIRPSGRMPDSRLNAEEATAIAAWLLRDQQDESNSAFLPGLRWQAFAWDGVDSHGPDWKGLKSFAHGVTREVHADLGGREDHYALQLDGYFFLNSGGRFTFYLGSDDGSFLSLDGEHVLDALYFQAHTEREVSVELAAGMHEIRIGYYEAAGDQSLSLAWSGPGFDRRPMGEKDLVHHGQAFRPVPLSPPPPPASVARGQELYRQWHCAACHEPAAAPAALAPAPSGSGAAGCLAEQLAPGLPDYHLAPADRLALLAAWRSPAWLTRPRAPREALATTMSALACNACHERAGLAAPSALARQHFQGSADLGEEGRIPPALDGVEDKLQPDWLGQVLIAGASVRPYMKARMPAYGERLGGELQAQFLALATPEVASTAPFDAEAVTMGRRLVGDRGFACLSCHVIAGHRAPGSDGLDLAEISDRLRPSWFRRWLRDPHRLRPDTRMPSFWDEHGLSALRDLADGRADLQIDAIWSYLSLGEAMPLPSGLLLDEDRYQLVPLARPIYFGTFMEGLSARVLTVGFPERISLAFDEEHVRLAKVWKGDFINAAGTWNGRAGQLESPAGSDILDLPAGPAFVFLQPGQAWPQASGREAGWRMRGRRRDAAGHPTFRYHHGDLEVEESLTPVLASEGPWLRRRFTLTSPTEPAPLSHRRRRADGAVEVAAVPFRQQPDGRWQATIEEEIRW